MSRDSERALVAMELLDVAEKLLERFQSYAPKQYRWATKFIHEIGKQQQVLLRRLDKEQP